MRWWKESMKKGHSIHSYLEKEEQNKIVWNLTRGVFLVGQPFNFGNGSILTGLNLIERDTSFSLWYSNILGNSCSCTWLDQCFFILVQYFLSKITEKIRKKNICSPHPPWLLNALSLKWSRGHPIFFDISDTSNSLSDCK